MALPLNWANISLLLLSQGGSECRVRLTLFRNEEKNVSKGLCFFHGEVVTPDLTFALTSLCPGAYRSLCQCHALPSISQKLLAGRVHAREGLPGKRCVYTYSLLIIILYETLL